MKNLKLSRKLLLISKLVRGNVVADVGCDHGKLCIYLALTKNIKLYACDVRKKPLEKAKENAKKYGVYEKIDFVLSDGLKNVPSSVDCIVVAGMGGKLIERIIFEQDCVRNKDICLILQPQSFLYDVRFNLYKNGFAIEQEWHIIEHKKCYDILVVYFKGKSEKINLKKAVLGEEIEKKNFYDDGFLDVKIKREEKILNGLETAKKIDLNKIDKQKEILKILREFKENV